MTTTSVTELADFAELAVASYALLDQGFSREVLKGQANMTDTQAADFLLKYDLVHHTPNNVVGFSATVFREKTTGKLIFAVRGTEIPSDIPADLLLADILQISPSGYAKSQATSMYRYWKELTTVGGASVNYSEGEIQQLYAVSKGLTGLLMLDVSTSDYINFRASVLSDKGVNAGQPTGTALISASAVVDVAGHSLGGHLAMLFARFFPSNTGEVVTLNAPGFFPNSSVLTALGFPAPADSKITRIEADGDGISELGFPGFWPGTKIAIAQENNAGVVASISSNHSSVNGNDALALMSMMATLDPTLANNATALSDFIRKGANTPGNSYESVLDGLSKILLGFSTTLTPITTGTDPAAREPYYLNLKNLQTSSAFQFLVGKVQIVAPPTSAADARSDLGAFLSLYNLTPFALHTTDAGALNQLYNANETIAAQWNADRNLTAEQIAQGEANYSDAWLTDRVAMLSWKLKLNTEDSVNAIATPYHDAPNQYFEDKTTGQQIVLGNPNMGQFDRRFIIFGSADGETLNGTAQSDRLYGGAGNDTLNGGGEVDHLEGGTGNDILNGGEGGDQLYGGADGDTLNGDGGADLLVGGSGEDHLYGGADSDTMYGDLQNPDDATVAYADDLHGGEGNDTLNGGGGDDQLYGDSGINTLNGDAGNDTLYGGDQTDTLNGGADDDKLYGQGGVDILDGGEGSDTLAGNLGTDTLHGGDNDDHLWGGAADIVNDTSDANRDTLYGESGNDDLHGGGGADLLDGGGDNDILDGEAGEDILIGGTGLDTYRYDSSTLVRDTILDSDGLGHIEFDRQTLVGTDNQLGSNLWFDEATGITYLTDGDPNAGPVHLNIIGGAGGAILIRDWHNGSLSITLDAKDHPPKPSLPKAPKKNNGAASRRDPLLIDLSGQGIQTVGINAGLHFDVDADGAMEATGWAAPGTGLLMLDRNGLFGCERITA